MLNHFKNRKSVSTKLSWEEKNPTDYTYRPSELMIRLRKEFKIAGVNVRVSAPASSREVE